MAMHDAVLNVTGTVVAKAYVEEVGGFSKFVTPSGDGVEPSNATIRHNPTVRMEADEVP